MPDETPSTEPPVEQPNAEGAASESRATDPAAADTTTPGGYSYTVVDDEAADDDGDAAAQRGGGIHPLVLVGAALAAAVVAGAAVWFFAPSSGGGGTSRLGADVTNVLNAFSQGQPGTITTRYEGELPAGFPGDMPTYAGAKVVASIAQVHGEDVGYLVIWDTSRRARQGRGRLPDKVRRRPLADRRRAGRSRFDAPPVQQDQRS